MTSIGYYSLFIAMFLSAYAGLASVVGVKSVNREMIASSMPSFRPSAWHCCC
jgi:cytochrome c biogenesis factor